MRVVDNRVKVGAFGDLKPGDIFMDIDDELNIVVMDGATAKFYAVKLTDGYEWRPGVNDYAIKLHCHLVIEN